MAKTTVNLVALAKVACTDEAAAVNLFIELRWPNGVACPSCGGLDPYRINRKGYAGHPPRRGLFKCSACKKQFTVTTGTVFEGTHVSLSRWLMAIHLMAASKKGMSALQLQRMLGVTYKAAWFVNHRLRYAMATRADLFAKLSGTVEVDETYVGGRRRIGPTNKADRAALNVGRPGQKDKKLTPVVALVERKGRLRLFPVERVTGKTLQDAIRSNVHENSHMMTDELHAYHALKMGFAQHDTINHTRKEYVRGNVHTNTVEGVFSLLKRGINGSFHHVSKGHLHRYCSEFEFRYNTRTALGVNDGERAALMVLGAEGKRLTYKSRGGIGTA